MTGHAGIVRQIPVYDGWRGLAVLMVLIGHFFINPGVNIGRFGIEMFFVLSGALMAKILFEDGQNFRTFAVRRFSRIYPALLLFCAAMGILALLLMLLGRSTQIVRTADVVATLALWFNQFRVFEGYYGGRFVNVWSVCVEVHSYAFIAAVAYITKRSIGFAIPLLIVSAAMMATLGVILFNIIPEASYYDVYWRSEVRIGSALIGAIGYLITTRVAIPSNSAYALALFLLSLLLSSDMAPEPLKYTAGTLALAAAVTVLGQAQEKPDFLRRILQARWLTFLGTISYSLYLWQYPLLILKRYPGGAIIALVLAIGLACASFYWFEAPARNFINRHMRTRQPAAKASTGAGHGGQ